MTLTLDSIDVVDWRGGISQDLFVSAQQVTGTFGPEGDAPVIEIDATGTVGQSARTRKTVAPNSPSETANASPAATARGRASSGSSISRRT